MKYRFLTENELGLLENDFENFLHGEGFKFTEWKRINKDAPENAQKLLAKFSDLIFYKVLKNVEYLEHRSAKCLRLFECREDSIVMIGIDIDKTSYLDLMDPNSLEHISNGNINSFKSFQIERAYEFNREDEIYNLMEGGCYVVGGECFNQLNLQRKSVKN